MEIKEILVQAIKGEIEGRELYKVAAERTEDRKGKEVLNYLAEEEDKHYEALSKMYQDLSEGRKVEMPDLGKPFSFDEPKSPIFSRDFIKRIKDKHFEMSALSIGLRLEMDAFRFYDKAAEKVDNPKLKEMFKKLSSWERGHYDMLQREIDYLQTEYFSKNNFTPL